MRPRLGRALLGRAQLERAQLERALLGPPALARLACPARMARRRSETPPYLLARLRCPIRSRCRPMGLPHPAKSRAHRTKASTSLHNQSLRPHRPCSAGHGMRHPARGLLPDGRRYPQRIAAEGSWQPRSRRPRASPGLTPPGVTAQIVRLRAELAPDNGADAIGAALRQIAAAEGWAGRGWRVPHRSTVNKVLKRA